VTDSDRETIARAIAFYLPQFHPIEENDEWWGPGFTEWTNVARARPLFPGHRQPHIPADLGFYDLRLAESREAQARLAARYGIEAFCYWHYWFGGRRILERPYSEMLASGQPDFSFCLAWANQTWSGIWYGEADRILIEQTYPGEDDDRQHFQHVLPAFRDRRYFKVDGKPLFYLFRPELHPKPAEFVARWRGLAEEAGLEGLYLVAELSDLLGAGPQYVDFERDGFDAGVYMRIPARVDGLSRLRMRFGRKFLRWPERYRYNSDPPEIPHALRNDRVHPCVYPNWDNTPRSGRSGLVVTDSSPSAFSPLVRAAVDSVAKRAYDHRLVFIKSWNEWAEGNYLEPDVDHGHGYLKAVAEEVFARTQQS
jgi:hypothetical protein